MGLKYGYWQGLEWTPAKLKSDQNGIEIWHSSGVMLFSLQLKSDQNGIEIDTDRYGLQKQIDS